MLRWYSGRIYASRASGLTLLLIIIVAAAAPLLTSQVPTFLDPGIRLQGLSSENWFGTDGSGRDVFARHLRRARSASTITSSCAAISSPTRSRR